MKFHNEEMILDKHVRVALIKEIEGSENKERKLETLKRYEILKDRIKKYIIQNLEKELEGSTVEEMKSRIATVNICFRIVPFFAAALRKAFYIRLETRA
jgi:hypothetical protein